MNRSLTLLMLLLMGITSQAQTVGNVPAKVVFSLNAGALTFSSDRLLCDFGLNSNLNPTFKGTFNCYVSENWGFGMEVHGTPVRFSTDKVLAFSRAQNVPSDFILLSPTEIRENGVYVGFNTGSYYRTQIGKSWIQATITVGLMRLDLPVPSNFIYKRKDTNFMYNQSIDLSSTELPTLSPQIALQRKIDQSLGFNLIVGTNISMAKISYQSILNDKLNYERVNEVTRTINIRPTFYVTVGLTFNRKPIRKNAQKLRLPQSSPVERLN